MSHRAKLSSIKYLSLSLAAAAALSACEPAEETNNQPGDMAGPDMPAPDMSSPDMEEDSGSDMAAGAALKAVSTASARTVSASAPAPITLDLTFEGAVPEGAMVEVVFGLPNIYRESLPASAAVEVTPPADAAHRGPVSVSVRYGDAEVALDGGLLYGAALGELALLKDGPQVLALPGIERADEVYPLSGGRFMVVQRAQPALRPEALSEVDDLYVVLQQTAAAVAGDGQLVLSRKRAKHMRTWSRAAAPSGVGQTQTSFAILLSRAADGGSELTTLGEEGGKLVERAALATFAVGTDVLDVVEQGDVIFALTMKDLGQGKTSLELINTSTAKVYRLPDSLDARSARLVQTPSIATGVVSAIGGVAVVGWRRVNAELAEAVVITHVATDGGQRTAVLHTVTPAPAAFTALEAVATHEEPTVRGEEPLTTLAYTARQGRELYVGRVKDGVPGEAKFEVALKPSLIGLEQDGIHATTYYTLPPRTNTQCRRNVCIFAKAHMRAPTGEAVAGGAYELELSFDGSQVSLDALGLQSGARLDTSREPAEWVGPAVVSRERGADGRLKVSAVSGDALQRFSVGAQDTLSIGAGGEVTAGAKNLSGAALLRSGADRVHVVIEAAPPSVGGGALRAAIFGIVLAVNNTKKAPPALVMPEGESLLFTDQMYVIEVKDGEDDVVFVVDRIDKMGARVPALLRVSASALKGLGASGELVVGQQAGLTTLPAGFVVKQLAGYGDTLYMLGAKGAEGLIKDGRYMGSLFELPVKASGLIPAALMELSSPSKIAEESGDPAAAFMSIAFDADPTTPSLVALLSGARPPGPKVKIARRFREPIFGPSRAFSVIYPPPSTVTIHSGDLIFQDESTFLMGFDGGDASKPIAFELTATGVEARPITLTGLAQSGLASASLVLADASDAWMGLTARVVQADLNGDGALDLLVASSADPQRRSYDLLMLGGPGGGFTPIFGPDATIYGAAPISQRCCIGPAMASKLKK